MDTWTRVRVCNSVNHHLSINNKLIVLSIQLVISYATSIKRGKYTNRPSLLFPFTLNIGNITLVN